MLTQKLIPLAAAALLAGCTGAQESEEVPLDTAAIEREVAAAFQAYTDALVEGDVEAATALVTEDTHFMEPGVLIDGREDFRAFLEGIYESGATVTGLEMQRHGIFAYEDAAYEFGTYDETIVTDGEETVVEGNVFVRWEKGDDGHWRIDRVVAGPRNAPEEGM